MFVAIWTRFVFLANSLLSSKMVNFALTSRSIFHFDVNLRCFSENGKHEMWLKKQKWSTHDFLTLVQKLLWVWRNKSLNQPGYVTVMSSGLSQNGFKDFKFETESLLWYKLRALRLEERFFFRQEGWNQKTKGITAILEMCDPTFPQPDPIQGPKSRDILFIEKKNVFFLDNEDIEVIILLDLENLVTFSLIRHKNSLEGATECTAACLKHYTACKHLD